MSDKDIHTIIQSYLTLEELHSRFISGIIDRKNLIQIFREQDIVLVKLNADDKYVSYKLMRRKQYDEMLNGLNILFSKIVFKSCKGGSKIYTTPSGLPTERNIKLSLRLKLERSNFTNEINTDVERMITFFENNGVEGYSSYLKLFDLINDCILFEFSNTNIQLNESSLKNIPSEISNLRNKVSETHKGESRSDFSKNFCTSKIEYSIIKLGQGVITGIDIKEIDTYFLKPNNVFLYNLPLNDCKDDLKLIVKCYYNALVQTKILDVKTYKHCLNYIKSSNNRLESYSILTVDVNPINVKKFQDFFGEEDVHNGCLDRFIFSTI